MRPAGVQPRSESQVSSQPPRPGRGVDASLAARAGVPRTLAAAAGGPCVAPPGARAFPPEFPSGSSDSRSKLNILGQREASCQVPALHGVLPPPPPPPPTPKRPRRHQPPKYQLNRGDRGAAAVAGAAAARRSVLCSPNSGPFQRAEKVVFPRETLLGNRRSSGRAGGTGSSLSLVPVGWGGGERTRAGGEGLDLGRIRGRRLFPGRRCRCSYFSAPPSSSSSESCREPQPKQAAASGSTRRPPPTAPPSHSEEKNT